MNQNTEENICRICLKRQDTLFSLFRKHHGTSPFEKLVRKTNLKIELNDARPASICSQCLIDLDTTVSFLEKCEQSNQTLALWNYRTDEECSNYKNDLIEIEVKEEVKDQQLTDEVHKNSINIVCTQNTGKKSLQFRELLPGTQNCLVCGSKRRCVHWTPPTSFTCQYCDKMFNKKYNFQLHIKRHIGERNWGCPKCGSLQLTESLARRHCSPKVPRHCPVPGCGKTFTNNNNLQIHVRTHSGERPFECHDCGKRFTSKKTLRDHVRIHTGEKPYMCPVCGKQFTSNHLSTHMSVHAARGPHGARSPHACPHAGCARRLASRSALREHARTHSHARAYACALCSSNYKYKQSLNKHVKKRHGVKSSQQS